VKKEMWSFGEGIREEVMNFGDQIMAGARKNQRKWQE